MIDFSREVRYRRLIIKTGNSSVHQLTLYQKPGFRLVHIYPNYFVTRYPQPIYENSVVCRDQIELEYRIFDADQLEEIVQKYWDNFVSLNESYASKSYSVWSFGCGEYQENSLIGLVRQGLKTGTSSALELYKSDEKMPEIGLISIITYGNGVTGCIIETTDVTVKRFDEIREHEALLEGEGDLSLEYWRNMHEYFFTQEY